LATARHSFRMPRQPRIPDHLLGQPFRTATASDAGASRSALRSRQLQRPYHGVRSFNLDLSVVENRCRAYLPRMPRGGVFSHTTAALLWNIPLPREAMSSPLDVTVGTGINPPKVVGVRGHRRAHLRTSERAGIPVTDAVDTWADLAGQVSLHDLFAAGDYVVTGDPFNNVLPLASIDDLHREVQARVGLRYAQALRAAIGLVAEGPLSRPESLVRLLLRPTGVPLPRVNTSVSDDRGSFLAIPDLAWPEWKVALEYEGDDHRAKRRFRDDIRRVERLVDHGWLVIKVSADDLFDRPAELVARVVRRLESRGWPRGRLEIDKVATFRR